MIKTTLYTYTHRFNKYPTYQVCATNRNDANGMLTLWTRLLPNYDDRNCDFDCTEKPINVCTKEDTKEISRKVFGE